MQLNWISFLCKATASALIFQAGAPVATSIKESVDARLAAKEALDKASLPPPPMKGVPQMDIRRLSPLPTKQTPPRHMTLLDEVGRAPAGLSAISRGEWLARARSGLGALTERARLQVWLGEYDLAVYHQPLEAAARFSLAARLSPKGSQVRGLALYDRAIAEYYSGAYQQAAKSFNAVLDGKENGFNRRDAAMFARHASSCASYHAEREKLGITEPQRLDPLCGVSAYSIGLASLGLPFDEKTVSKLVRHDGEGSTLQDLQDAADRMGLSGRAFTATDEAIKALPMPLVAHVERDHFVSVVKADAKGVTYRCSDCGRWPGGYQFVTWKQWRAMEPGVYFSLSRRGGPTDQALNALTGEPERTLWASTRGVGGLSPKVAVMVARVPAGSMDIFLPLPWVQCLIKPESQHCKPCITACPTVSGGASTEPASALAGDPVNLATGEEEYRPSSDLAVYNPKGPNVVWQRWYNSLSNGRTYSQYYVSHGFGLGWSHEYNVGIEEYAGMVATPTGSATPAGPTSSSTQSQAAVPPGGGGDGQVSGNVVFQNTSRVAFTGTLPTATTLKTRMTVPAGTPFIVDCTYDATTTKHYFTATFKDRAKWECEADPENSSSPFHRLRRIYDRVGNYISFVYGSHASGGPYGGYGNFVALDRIDDSAGQALLTFGYNNNARITSVSDRYGRSVYYSFTVIGGGAQILYDASQIVATGTANPPIRYRHGYTQIDNGEGLGMEFLNAITVPSPTGTGTSTGTFNYTSRGYIESIVDANGNRTVFTQTPGNTTKVSRTNSQGVSAQEWTVSFNNSMADTGSTNALGQSKSSSVYGSANNPNAPSSVTDGNGRTWSYTYDVYGNPLTATSPKSVTTTYGYDYSQFPLGELVSVQTGSKPSTEYVYHEPSGLIYQVLAPVPGQVGSSSKQATTFNYSALGNVTSIVMPGNNAAATRTTTLGYTNDGAYAQAECLGKPIVVTDPSGKATHLRYDARGNRTSSVDPLNKAVSMAYNIADQPTMTVMPPTGSSGSGSATQSNVFIYVGGPTIAVESRNEAGTLVRTANMAYGPEGEVLSRSGSAESFGRTYDAAYRTKTYKDGNNAGMSYTYDLVGRVVKIDYPGATGANYDRTLFTSYDAANNLLSRVDGRGLVTNYSYADVDGMLSGISYTGNTSSNVSLSYDNYDRLTQITDATGTSSVAFDDIGNTVSSTRTYTGLAPQTTSYTYWPDGSRKTMVNVAGTWTYGYDLVGRATSLVSPAGSSSATFYDNGLQASRTLPNGAVTTYAYNDLGMLTSMSNKTSSGGTLSQYGNLTYDGTFNLVGVTSAVTGYASQGGTTAYAYDAKNRLTQESSARNGGYTGNYAYDASGNPTTFKGAAQTFNADNQRTSGGTFAYDGNGNPTTYKGTTMAFDPEDRATSLGTTVTAGYRADGLRGWKAVSGAKTYYLYDHDEPVVELNSSGQVTAVNVFAMDGLVGRKQAGSWTYYTFDQQGNVGQRLNASQAVVSSSIYDAYGTESSVGSPTDPFGYNARVGYLLDRETGLYLCQHRYYDPGAGRWLTRDPLGPMGGVDLYSYCQSRPVSMTDESGKMPSWDCIKKCLLSGLVGFVAGCLTGAGWACLSAVALWALACLEGPLPCAIGKIGVDLACGGAVASCIFEGAIGAAAGMGLCLAACAEEEKNKPKPPVPPSPCTPSSPGPMPFPGPNPVPTPVPSPGPSPMPIPTPLPSPSPGPGPAPTPLPPAIVAPGTGLVC